MKKKDREIVFNKYGGKCAYCGDPLKTGWHADHAEPIERKFKSVPSGWFHKITGDPAPNEFRKLSEEEFEKHLKVYEHKPSRLVSDGCHKPENNRINNMMPSCPSCNINKHSLNIEEFRGFIARFINSLNNTNTLYKIAKRYNLIQETNKPVIFFFETFCKQKTN